MACVCSADTAPLVSCLRTTRWGAGHLAAGLDEPLQLVPQLGRVIGAEVDLVLVSVDTERHSLDTVLGAVQVVHQVPVGHCGHAEQITAQVAFRVSSTPGFDAIMDANRVVERWPQLLGYRTNPPVDDDTVIAGLPSRSEV
jgi:hypothetical protein